MPYSIRYLIRVKYINQNIKQINSMSDHATNFSIFVWKKPKTWGFNEKKIKKGKYYREFFK